MFFPLRGSIDAGIHIAGGRDGMIRWDKNTATNPYNPFLGLWNCITRKTIRGSVIHQEQKITREEALRDLSDCPGRRTHVRPEKSYGSIETGKLADLVVTDRELYLTCPEDDIARIEPAMTVLDRGSIKWHKTESSEVPGLQAIPDPRVSARGDGSDVPLSPTPQRASFDDRAVAGV